MTSQLELATTDELMDELMRRHQVSVFLALKPPKDQNKGGMDYWFRYAGGVHACVGLMADLTNRMLQGIYDMEVRNSDAQV